MTPGGATRPGFFVLRYATTSSIPQGNDALPNEELQRCIGILSISCSAARAESRWFGGKIIADAAGTGNLTIGDHGPWPVRFT